MIIRQIKALLFFTGSPRYCVAREDKDARRVRDDKPNVTQTTLPYHSDSETP
jgi:hypothetical protein